jgi:hypothetical protein
MQRVTVNGGWIDYREPEDTPERLRRRVTMLAAQAPSVTARVGTDGADVNEDDMRFLLSFNDAVAMCLVEAWAWDEPVTVEGLQNLPGRVYDEIVKYCQSLMSRLLPSFAVDVDPKALTES